MLKVIDSQWIARCVNSKKWGISGATIYFNQLVRDGRCAIYEQSFKDKDGKPFKRKYWEVIKILTKKIDESWSGSRKYTKLGYTHIERYPHHEQWGQLGFTYTKLEDAQNKFRELVEAEVRKEEKLNEI